MELNQGVLDNIRIVGVAYGLLSAGLGIGSLKIFYRRVGRGLLWTHIWRVSVAHFLLLGFGVYELVDRLGDPVSARLPFLFLCFTMSMLGQFSLLSYEKEATRKQVVPGHATNTPTIDDIPMRCASDTDLQLRRASDGKKLDLILQQITAIEAHVRVSLQSQLLMEEERRHIAKELIKADQREAQVADDLEERYDRASKIKEGAPPGTISDAASQRNNEDR